MLNFGGCKPQTTKHEEVFGREKFSSRKCRIYPGRSTSPSWSVSSLANAACKALAFLFFFVSPLGNRRYSIFFRHVHNWFLYKNCWYLNISAIRTCKNPMLSFHASNATKTDPHKFQEDPFIHPSWETIQRWLASGETPAWVKWRYALPQIERSNFGKGTTWKAKCPIFKALVAGFRGKAA